MSDPNLNANTPLPQSGLLGPGGTQSAASAAAAQVHGTGQTDYSKCVVKAVLGLIAALGWLNNFLKTVSSTLLNADLVQDQNYANNLSNLQLETPIEGAGHTETNQQRSVYNQKQMMRQQVLQARLKTHQNQEQIDIQSASTTTSNMQQLATQIGSMIDLMSQIFGSINTINRG